jgi:MinD superfamily P-loop ATPase/ubiquinone/menaquinone biosynthesis C-methylase UbiE
MDSEILDNHKRYLERVALFKSYGYDVEKERNFIVEQAKPLCGKILEAGTGKGHFALALAKEEHPFVTFDISADEQRFAKLNIAYFGFDNLVDFRIENAERTSFADQSFDIIFSVNVLHHLQKPYQVIEELVRILSSNGKIILADFTEEGFKIMDKIHALEGRSHEKGNVALSDVESYLIKKGFSVIKTKSLIQEVLVAKKVLLKNMVISIASGKGGTGKTTIAVNLALSIQHSIYIDCDVEEPNGHILLKPVISSRQYITQKQPKINSERCTFCGKCSELCEFNAIIVLKSEVMIFYDLCHGCGVCSYFCPEHAIQEIERSFGEIRKGYIESESVDFVDGTLNIGEMHGAQLIKQVRKEALPDRINIIDAPPGTSCSMVAAVKDTDYCILVTESTPFGLNDLKLAVHVVRLLGMPFGVIINKYDEHYPALDNYCLSEQIPSLLKIPFDRKIAEYYSQGMPLVYVMPQLKESFRQLFEQIQSVVQKKEMILGK